MKILISGNYGAGNIGDELILEGLIKCLKSIEPKIEITVFSANPEHTKKTHEVNSVHKFPAGIKSLAKHLFITGRETKTAMKSCDYFILGGGGLFSNLTFRANTIWGIQAQKAISFQKKMLQLGQSISPLENKIVKRMIKNIFNQSEIISVRDEESRNRLLEWGIEQEINLVPDYAFRITEIPKSDRKKVLLVCLREISNIDGKFLDEISKLIKAQIKQGYQIKFINFQNGESHDKKLHKGLIEKLEKNDTYEMITPKSSSELFNIFSQSKLVLGMRLHSTITATKTETPFIAINYSDKVKDYLKTTNLIEYCFDQKNINSEEISQKIKGIEENYSQIQKNLAKINSEYLEQHLKFESRLKKYFQIAS